MTQSNFLKLNFPLKTYSSSIAISSGVKIVAIDDAVGGVADADVGAFPSRGFLHALVGVNLSLHSADLVAVRVIGNRVADAAGEHSVKIDVPLESSYSNSFTK